MDRMSAACTVQVIKYSSIFCPFSSFVVHNLDGVEIPGPLNPLANVLLVKVKDAADISAGGIVLPDQVCTRLCCILSYSFIMNLSRNA